MPGKTDWILLEGNMENSECSSIVRENTPIVEYYPALFIDNDLINYN